MSDTEIWAAIRGGTVFKRLAVGELFVFDQANRDNKSSILRRTPRGYVYHYQPGRVWRTGANTTVYPLDRKRQQ